MLESLNGFFIIISATNEIVFVSENIEQHMGLSQVRLWYVVRCNDMVVSKEAYIYS